MSITIGGHTWRTLAQPLYAGGQLVKEVYANGVKVYPEATEGQLVKVFGNAMIHDWHTHVEERRYNLIGWLTDMTTTWGPCMANYAFSAQFVAVIRGKSSSAKTTYSNADFGSIVINESKHNFELPSTATGYSGTDWRGLVKPITQRHVLDGDSLILSTSTSDYDIEVMLKMGITPIPTCDTISATWHTGIWSHSYGSYRMMGATFDNSPMEFSGVPLRFTGTGKTFDSASKELYGSGSLSVSLGRNKSKPGATFDSLSVSATCPVTYTRTYVVNTDSSREHIKSQEIQKYRNTESFLLGRIPITQCWYAGTIEDAPEEMRQINDGDV